MTKETVLLPDSSSLTFSSSWQVLGPFQIGTREAAWTADPLEKHGSFSNISKSTHPYFPSSLAPNAQATWSSIAANLSSSSASSLADLHVSFPEVQWSLLRLAYGWSSTQWQGWIRGTLSVPQKGASNDTRVRFWASGPIEIVIDGQRFWGGDFYGFSRTPTILHLQPGEHKVEARIVRDVRSMGGIDKNPAAEIKFRAEIIGGEEDLEVRRGTGVLPDLVDGVVPTGRIGGVSVTNVGQGWLEIFDIQCGDKSIKAEFWSEDFTTNAPEYPIAPGQTRAFTFRIGEIGQAIETVPLHVSYRPLGANVGYRRLTVEAKFRHVDLYSVQKITYQHPSGTVSYSMLRPPSKTTCSNVTKAPIMLLLHGAGVEADSPVVRESFDELLDLCAWVLFPSGVTTWSGDDWHIWGQRDVTAAKEAISQWIKEVGWTGIGVDINKVLISGHSNGGQGVWHTLTHHPGDVFAAVPVSGYLSIPLYVPFTFWHPMDGRKRALLEAATASYRHDLLTPNFKGVPVFQQHGSDDDNVPAYHSRLMHELIDTAGFSSNYSELTGKGHWWKGVMTTGALKRFYKEQFANPKMPTLSDVGDFEIIVSNPSDLGGRFGLVPLYVREPGQLGRIRVSFHDGSASIEVENILAFKIEHGTEFKDISIIDSDADGSVMFSQPTDGSRVYYKTEVKWGQTTSWKPPRLPEQFLGLEVILKTDAPIPIRLTNMSLLPTAVQMANNFHQYFAADSIIVNVNAGSFPYHDAKRFRPKYAVTLAIGTSLSPCKFDKFPIEISDTAILSIRDSAGRTSFPGKGKPLGAIFLRPSDSGVEVIVWGSSESMFGQAARLVPMLTGTGQPDFIILTEEARWKGVEGAYLGFFDAWWQVSKASVIP